MSIASRKVASYLLSAKAVQLSVNNPFTWASGLRSPIYCDNRKILSYVDIRNEVKKIFVEQANLFGQAEIIAGVATAGIPMGVLLADALEIPFIYVRSKAKGHGLKSKIEGSYKKGLKTLVIEDLISTGGSSLEAVRALRDEGLIVLGVMAIFSYELEVAKKNFEGEKCKWNSLSGYSSLIELAAEENYIDIDELKALKKWSKNPENWSTELK